MSGRARYTAKDGRVYGPDGEERGSALTANGRDLEAFDRALDQARAQREARNPYPADNPMSRLDATDDPDERQLIRNGLPARRVELDPHHPTCRYPASPAGYAPPFAGYDPERCCYCAALIRGEAQPLDFRYGGPGCFCS